LSVRDLDDAAGRFLRDGFLIIEGLFEPETIARMQRAFHDRYGDKDFTPQRNLQVGDRRWMVSVEVEPPFDDPQVIANPWLLGLLQRLLGDEFVLYNFGCIVALPGAAPQHIHGDHPQLFGVAEPAEKVFAITCVVPLLDLGTDTGCTAAWLGSHVDPNAAMEAAGGREPFTYTLRGGDCYLMDARVLHAGRPNRSAVPRPILYLLYGRSWFRDVSNVYRQEPVVVSQDRVRAMRPEMRRLFTHARPYRERNEVEPREEPPPAANRKILLVADEDNVIELVRQSLEPAHSVRVARLGDDVLSLLRAQRADLVVVDVDASDPRGMDVVARIRSVAELHKQTVLMMTERWTEQDSWHGWSSTENFFVSKPIGARQLADFVGYYIFR
jgi:CheY-like chemotaxis protein